MATSFKMSKRFILTFITSFALVLCITAMIINGMCQLERASMERIILNQGNKLTSVLSKLLYRAHALAALVVQHNGAVENFEKVASILMDDPAILNVILAPNGIVTKIYPLKGNEAAVGLDYFSEGAGNREAIAARDKKTIVMGGPFPLVQGGEALVGRMPVYLNHEDGTPYFWGLVSVTLRFPQALADAELDKLADLGLAYELWRISPDTGVEQRIVAANYDYNKNAPYVEMPLRILNADWVFRLAPILLWYQYTETWFCVAMGFIFSLLLAFLVQQNSDLQSIKLQLENLSRQDGLTGILNRRGLLALLRETVDSGKDFLLFFIDLDGFKAINDQFGHAAGDFALRTFAQTAQRRLTLPHAFGRMGGDEFMLVVYGTKNEAPSKAILAELAAELHTNTFKGQTMPIAFSMGMVAFPGDSNNLDDLLALADTRMYADKRKMS